MYLSYQQTKLLGQLIASLAEPLEEHEVRARVGADVLRLFDAQYYVSYVWDSASKTFGNGININMDPGNLRAYERYYQFHDPITPAMQRWRSPVRATDVLSHEQLKKSEFFNDFLARDGLYWGVNLYAWDADQNIGDMRIWRDRRRENFAGDDLALLDMIQPAFVAALKRCRRTATVKAPPFEARPIAALSEREVDVVQLMSCGLSDKEIARRLGISVATVRTHVGHAFRKQGVDSRMKLVHALGL